MSGPGWRAYGPAGLNASWWTSASKSSVIEHDRGSVDESASAKSTASKVFGDRTALLAPLRSNKFVRRKSPQVAVVIIVLKIQLIQLLLINHSSLNEALQLVKQDKKWRQFVGK